MDERVAAWAASGAMALTGRSRQPPLGPPAPLVDGLRQLGNRLDVDALQLLGERAALLGLERHGDTSCGGATRLLHASDGWLAVTLSRAEDIDAVPAWLELDGPRDDAWDVVTAAVRSRPADELVSRAMLLGMPVAALPAASTMHDDAASPSFEGLPVHATAFGPSHLNENQPPLVVDLSSLWAGPLCGQLLQGCGARVVKVESRDRPDGARRGSPAFFDLMNGGKASVVIDFRSRDGAAALRALMARADVVIEASRPRALEQLGVVAADFLRADGGPVVWLSITGYGRTGDDAMRVGFGDDAAVAGGLVVYDDRGPCFCADAIADPISGMVAAAAARAALQSGRRWLLDVAMARVVADLAGPTLPVPPDLRTIADPVARPVVARATPFGRDTREVCARTDA